MPILLRRCSLIAFVAIVLAGCTSETTKAPAVSESNRTVSPQSTPAQVQSSSSSPLSANSIPTERSVYYDLDQSDIRPGDRAAIEVNAKYLREHPELKVRIEGNTDERGSTEYNLALGQRRAEGVAKALELLGVTDDRIEAVSFGKEKPRNTGHDEASWAVNRRSDIDY